MRIHSRRARERVTRAVEEIATVHPPRDTVIELLNKTLKYADPNDPRLPAILRCLQKLELEAVLERQDKIVSLNRAMLVSQKELNELDRLDREIAEAEQARRAALHEYCELQDDLVRRIEFGARIERGPLTFHFGQPSLKPTGDEFPPGRPVSESRERRRPKDEWDT